MRRNSHSFKEILMVSTLLILATSLLFVSIRASGSSGGYEKWGPRVDYTQLIIYGTYEAEVAAFLAGDVDMIDWPLDYDTYLLIEDDPDFVVENLTMYDCYDIDINCLRWPTSDYRFRQAIAHLIDYETFYTSILRAYAGGLMDNILWQEWTKWYNPTAPKYWYNRTIATSILAAAGYKNWDADSWLEWKAPNGTVYELPTLDFYARKDDPLRHALGDLLNAELIAVGIPTKYTVAERSICWNNAYRWYTYHLYTAGMGPFVDPQFLYDYYHSKFATPEIEWCMNNVFFMNDTYDYWVEKMKFAPDEATAIEGCKKAQEIFMDQVPLIPVYNSAGATAYRAKYGHHLGEEPYWDKPWKGVVNSIIPTTTCGVNDWWTLLNAHSEGVERDGVLRYGMMNDADHVNPVTVYSYWDAIITNEIYSTLFMRDPYNGDRIPWMAKEWKVETWNYGGKNATQLTLTLCPNIKWSDGTPLNSTDVAFTMKYMYDAVSASWYPDVEAIDGINTTTPNIQTPDPYTVVIRYNVQTVWALDWAGVIPIIPKHVWETIPPSQANRGEFERTGNLTGSGPYVIDSYKKNEWWLLRANPYYFRNTWHDIALTDMKSPKTIVGQGCLLNITLTVENTGSFNETVNIEVYANTTLIATIPNMPIVRSTSETITIAWNTTGFAKGNYTLKAETPPVAGEIMINDNTLTDGWVIVALLGDINADGIVDISDIYLIALAFGAMPPDPNYDPNLDIVYDEIIDIADIYTAAIHFGETDL